MARGTYAGTGPDGGVTDNFERQAVGLPHTGDNHVAGQGFMGIIPSHWFDPRGASENTYRAERNQLGLGDNFLPRNDYASGVPGQAP